MCFAPQRRAIFGHRNFKKWPESVVFCTFWLKNVLRATAACNFSGSELQNWLPLRCFVHFDLQMCFAPQRRAIFGHRNFKKCSDTVSFFSIFTSKCAFRHQRRATSAPAALARLLFQTSGTTNHWKNTAIRDVANISRTCSFFSSDSTTRVDLLSADLTSLLCLTPLLCFSTLHTVGS